MKLLIAVSYILVGFGTQNVLFPERKEDLDKSAEMTHTIQVINCDLEPQCCEYMVCLLAQ